MPWHAVDVTLDIIKYTRPICTSICYTALQMNNIITLQYN